MIVYPAIDLMGGRCVRLRQGKFEEPTVYPADPAEALVRFAEAGATWAHIVDLDGARMSQPVQHHLLTRLASSARIDLQVAGGFRTRDQVALMLDAGIGRVIIGSLAVQHPRLVQKLFDEFGPERVGLAFDVNLINGVPIVAVRGWTETSGVSLFDAADRLPQAKHLLVTDIVRDGMMQGPNLALLKEARRRLPDCVIQSSGGVRHLDDLKQLKAIGAEAAIVGKALWEGGLDLAGATSLAGA